MLVITNAQLAAVQAARDRALATHLVADLRADHEKRVDIWEQDDLTERVCQYITRARRYGLSVERDVRFFVSLQLLVARDWDLFPPIGAWLRRGIAGGQGTLEYLVSRLGAEDWRQIRVWSERRA